MNRQTSASSQGKSFCITVYLPSPHKQTGGEDLGCLLASPSLLSFNSIYYNAFPAVLLELSQEPPNYAATCPVAYIQNLYICAHMSEEVWVSAVGRHGAAEEERRAGCVAGYKDVRSHSFNLPSFYLIMCHFLSSP